MMVIQESVLCDLCSNASRGIQLPGKRICFDCASDDPELVKEIIETMMAEGGMK